MIKSIKDFYKLLEENCACPDGLADIASCGTLAEVFKLPKILEHINWAVSQAGIADNLSPQVINKFQQVVIDSGNARYCCIFAEYVNGADIINPVLTQ
jgi:hypothetical protein